MKGILFSLLLSAPLASATTEIANVEFQSAIEIADTQLTLDGAGLLRWKGIFKVYVAGFYRELPDSGFALDSDETQALEIEYLRDVSADGFVKATRVGLESTLPEGETLADWDAPLSEFLDAYRSVERGDRYRLVVMPDSFELLLNGQALYRSDQTALGRRLLGVWLNEGSLSPSLRADLLAAN